MATTSNGGCAQPVVRSDWGTEVTLSVTGSFDTYQWSTGETTPTVSSLDRMQRDQNRSTLDQSWSPISVDKRRQRNDQPLDLGIEL